MARLVVLNKDADTLSVVDPVTGETDRTVETEFNPHEVAVGPGGEQAFVTCSLGGALLVYDTDTWERVATIEHELFEFPHGLAVRASAGELWLAATYSSTLFVIDPDTHEVLATFPTHQEKSHMVSLSPDESRAYVANIGSDSVTVVDCDERRVLADPPVGEEPEGIAAMEEYVLVANQEDGTLSVLDNDDLEVTNRALLGETPIRVVPQPGGRYVFVPNRESNDVSVIDTEHVRDGERRPWEIAVCRSVAGRAAPCSTPPASEPTSPTTRRTTCR
jgi:40-residue YVTN family beta-propeller repeat